MILQTDKRLNVDINKYGCYFMGLLFIASKYACVSFSPTNIEDTYYKAVDENWLGSDCYVKNPAEILRYFGLEVDHVRKEAGDLYESGWKETEIMQFLRSYKSGTGIKSYYHFVVGAGENRIAYDPMGISNAVRYGHIESKRIVRFKKDYYA